VQLCSRCNAAVDAGQSNCQICGQSVGTDRTGMGGSLDPAPPGPAPGSAPVPPPEYTPGYAPVPTPGYGQQPGYAQPGYAAPPKSKAVAALLCFFLGGLGIHRFYTGQVGLGLGLLLTTLFLGWTVVWLGVTFVWVMIDLVLILSGGVRDQWGRPLT
jgi:TM2 domain-containing membrane protein YozV